MAAAFLPSGGTRDSKMGEREDKGVSGPQPGGRGAAASVAAVDRRTELDGYLKAFGTALHDADAREEALFEVERLMDESPDLRSLAEYYVHKEARRERSRQASRDELRFDAYVFLCQHWSDRANYSKEFLSFARGYRRRLVSRITEREVLSAASASASDSDVLKRLSELEAAKTHAEDRLCALEPELIGLRQTAQELNEVRVSLRAARSRSSELEATLERSEVALERSEAARTELEEKLDASEAERCELSTERDQLTARLLAAQEELQASQKRIAELERAQAWQGAEEKSGPGTVRRAGRQARTDFFQGPRPGSRVSGAEIEAAITAKSAAQIRKLAQRDAAGVRAYMQSRELTEFIRTGVKQACPWGADMTLEVDDLGGEYGVSESASGEDVCVVFTDGRSYARQWVVCSPQTAQNPYGLVSLCQGLMASEWKAQVADQFPSELMKLIAEMRGSATANQPKPPQ